jgi:hypothetical protein
VIRRRGGALTAAVVVLSALAGPWRARAASDSSGRPLLVVLFTVTSDDPLAGRIDAELRALGFEVSRAAIAPEVGIEALVGRALAAGARAAVVADGHRTDVWIAEEGTDRVALRQELEVDETSGLQSVLALRTVEFLRISTGVGGPVALLPASPPPQIVAPSTTPSSSEIRWLAVDVSSGVLASVGRLGPFAIAGARLRAGLGGLFGVELSAYAPLTDIELSDAGAQIRTSVWLAGGGLLLAPRSEQRWALEAAAGMMAFLVRSTGSGGNLGTSGAPATGETDQGLAVALYGRGAARLRLGSRWSLRVELLAGGAVRRPAIVFPNGDVARWGTAFAAGLGGAEMRF